MLGFPQRLAMILGTLVFSVALLTVQDQAQGTPFQPQGTGGRFGLVNPLQNRAAGALLPPPQLRVGPARLPSSATHAAVQGQCPGANLFAVCGTVKVPLDRTRPQNGNIAIFFELFTHFSGGPAQSAILVNFGGPGSGATAPFWSYTALTLFAKDLDYHDLLLIDDRGRGFSGTINCVPLQQGTEPFAKAEADCAAQLGRAASRYGTGDIAADTEAVRSALGYPKVDYYGWSTGGEDVTAYATRYGSHLRSIVLDAARGTPDLNPLVQTHNQIPAHLRMVRLACAYSPTCRPDHPDPVADLKWLIHYLRAHPVEGQAYDNSGSLVPVRIDEFKLLGSILGGSIVGGPQPFYFYGPFFITTGEIVAAAASLRQGDRVPLLRLGAEADVTLNGINYGNPTTFSMGALLASACSDAIEPWNWSDPVSQRIAEDQHAIASLPPDYFAPFSKAAATSVDNSDFGAACLWWQKPTPSSPVAPPHPTYPKVPTLVLSGTMDNNVPLEGVTRVAALFPGSILIPVAGSGHGTMVSTHCAANLGSQFIETLQLGDIRCTKTPETVYPAVGRFPLFARDAVAAAIDVSGHNEVGVTQRKVVTVAVAAATDVVQRYLLGYDFHCLRGGTFTTSAPYTFKLTGCSFAKDVSVNGTVRWYAQNAFAADLVVSGAGTPGGTLHVAGTFDAPGPVGNFRVSGKIGGLRVAVLVPEA